jgi:hypothetical protein
MSLILLMQLLCFRPLVQYFGVRSRLCAHVSCGDGSSSYCVVCNCFLSFSSSSSSSLPPPIYTYMTALLLPPLLLYRLPLPFSSSTLASSLLLLLYPRFIALLIRINNTLFLLQFLLLFLLFSWSCLSIFSSSIVSYVFSFSSLYCCTFSNILSHFFLSPNCNLTVILFSLLFYLLLLTCTGRRIRNQCYHAGNVKVAAISFHSR